MSPHVHLPGLLVSDTNMDITNINFQDTSDLSDTPLGDALHHLKGDERADNSSKVARKKHQLPSLPSPPSNTPEPFNMPAKSLASIYMTTICSFLVVNPLIITYSASGLVLCPGDTVGINSI
ncbi:hypothetical protein BDR05DRAFT_1000685 [Suillus weaverae]|nr:hypothetical protein BDR05DRAFT_1000685 [Suillus weaverae]